MSEHVNGLAKKLVESIPESVINEVFENLEASELDDFRIMVSTNFKCLIEEKMVKKLEQEEVKLETRTRNLLYDTINAVKAMVARHSEAESLKKKIKKLEKERPRQQPIVGQNDELEKDVERGHVPEVMQQGPVDPLKVFPEEIWRIIIGKIDDPETLRRVAKTNTFFERLLNEKRTEMLLGPVLPFIFCKLTVTDTLNLRLVSSSWCKDIDRYYEEHPVQRPLEDDRNIGNTRLAELQLFTYRFDNTVENSIRNNGFIEAMEDHPRNPFIGRNFRLIEVREDFYNQDDIIKPSEFWRQVISFLTKFGEHIFYMQFQSAFGRNMNKENLHALLQSEDGRDRQILKFITTDIFRLCPNLRKLYIGGTIFTNETTWRYGYTGIDPTRSCTTSTVCTDSSLESLNFENLISPINKVGIIPIISHHNPHIKSLAVTTEQWSVLSGLSWTGLRELYIEKISTKDQIRNLIGLNLPGLKKLGFDFMYGYFPEALAIVLTVIVNVCRNSKLTVLRISGYVPFDDMSLSFLTPDLWGPATVETLEIGQDFMEMSYEKRNYSYLLRFPFLKKINLFYKQINYEARDFPRNNNDSFSELYDNNAMGKPDQIEGILGVRDAIGSGRLFGSYLWEILPLLQLFVHNDTVYARRENFVE